MQTWSRIPAGTKVLIVGVVALTIAVSVVIVRTRVEPVMAVLPLGTMDEGQRRRVVAALESLGVEHRETGEGVAVPADRFAQSLAALRVQGLVSREAAGGLAALMTHKPAWYLSNEQNRQVYNLALQEELSRVVSAYPHVRRATVLVSHPQGLGFAATHRRPSASVSVEMASGTLEPRTVDAIAGLVSGAVAEMRPQDIAVIDATAGRQFKSRATEEGVGGQGHDLKVAVEQACRERIVAALGYIDGVIVAVNAEVDLVERQTRSDIVDPAHTFELRTREKSETLGEGRESLTSDQTEREYEPAVSRHQETAVNPGGLPTRISATVNVPRSFFVAAYRRQAGPAETEPGDAQLQPIIDEQVARIRRQVEPLVLSREPGQVVVDVYPDGATTTAAPVLPATTERAGATAPVAGAQLPPWSSAAGVGVLVAALLGLCFARLRSVQKTDTPRSNPRANDQSVDADLSTLRDEHPQAIAMILSRLPEDAAARALVELPEQLQSQVLERMAGLAEPHPDILNEVDEYIACRRAESQPPVSPDMLDQLDDATIRGVLDEVGGEELRLAMRVASESFRRRVLRQLPEDQARRLREELAAESPVRISEVEEAQRRVLEVAAQYQSIAGIAA